jgi:hypothetical protein
VPPVCILGASWVHLVAGGCTLVQVSQKETTKTSLGSRTGVIYIYIYIYVCVFVCVWAIGDSIDVRMCMVVAWGLPNGPQINPK